MPSYLYHLHLEVLCNSDRFSSNSLAIESAWEALLPFQKRSRPSSSASAHHDTNLAKKHDKKEGAHSAHSSSGSSSSTQSPFRRPSSAAFKNRSPHLPSTLHNDLRSSPIAIQCIDMVTPENSAAPRPPARKPSGQEENLVATGIGTDILGGLRTKGRYIPLDQEIADSVWGIVHLYREIAETPYLASSDDDYPTHLKGSAAAVQRRPAEQLALRPQAAGDSKHTAGRDVNDSAAYPFPVTASSSAIRPDDDCSTLCVLAVPSYLSGSDFLGFVGQKTLDDVSHFRMIRTPRANRYMVLMKFRSGRKAMEWQKEWNGKVFNSMEVSTLLEQI